MASTSLDLSQIKTDALSAASTFRTLIGLGNIDNTSDANKPISSATQSALDGKLSLTGGTLTGAVTSNLGTVTSSTPALTINQTWNNAAATFNLLSATLSNTASNNDSYWINFQGSNFWGGNNTPVFRVRGFDGQITVCGKWGDGSIRLGGQSIGCLITAVYGTGLTFAVQGSTNFTIGTHGQYGNNSIFGNWHVNNSLAFTGSGFAGYISWDASNILALKNSTNAQRFNLYGTYTDASNYRRLYISSTTAGAFTLGVEGAGTGASGNTLTINNPLTISSNLNAGEGIVLQDVDGGYFKISQSTTTSGAFQPVFEGYAVGNSLSSVIFKGLQTTGTASPNGVVRFITRNFNDTDAIPSSNVAFQFSNHTTNLVTILGNGLIVLGDTTSSFPAIKRNGTAINFRLADDSADAPITASNGTFSGALSAVTKSFLIDHPTKPGRKLQYGSLESPYHGIRLTGRGTINNGTGLIELPDYVRALVNDDINIQLTPIGRNTLWVDFVELNNKIVVGGDLDGDFYWSFTGIRTDVELEVEPWA